MLRSRYHSRMITATPQMAVTIHPVEEKLASISSTRVPVFLKKVSKMLNWQSSVTPVTTRMSVESMARSVTTVPRALGNDTPSHRLSTPHRANSPMRGMIRLTAYERNTELIATAVRGFSPTGSSVCRHRQPRKACAMMPNGNDSSIHVQLISWNSTCSMRWKSKSRYIQ